MPHSKSSTHLRRPPRRSPRKKPKPADPGSRRQGERDRARSRILLAATHLFAQRGIENVTYGDIARRARMSRPLVYFYFPDLQSLFLEASLGASIQLHDRIAQSFSASRTGLEAIVAMIRSFVDFHEEKPELFYLSTASLNSRPTSRRPLPAELEIAELERATMKLALESLSRGMSDGSVRRDISNPLMVTLSIWAFVQGLVQLTLRRRDTIERLLGPGERHFLDSGFEILRGALAPPH